MNKTLKWLFFFSLFIFSFGCQGDDYPKIIPEDEQPDISDGDEQEPDTAEDGDITEDEGAEAIEESEDNETAEDGENTEDVESAYPDPNFVFEVREQPNALSDTAFKQPMSELFRTVEQLPVLDVKGIEVFGNTTFIATDEGLFQKKSDGAIFSKIEALGDDPIVAISPYLYEDEIVVAKAQSISMIDKLSLAVTDTIEYPVVEIVDIVAGFGRLVINTNGSGVLEYSDEEGWAEVALLDGRNVHSLALEQTGLLVAGVDSGVVFEARETMLAVENGGLFDADIRDIATCGNIVLTATKEALSVFDTINETFMHLVPKPGGGLPTNNLLSIDCNETGIVIGHEIGATHISWMEFANYIALDNDDGEINYEHFISQRWTPDNLVQTVAIGENGELWFGTPNGASRIYRIERTLSEKEVVFDSYVPYYWRMDGFFSSDGSTPDPFDDWEALTHHDHDNDGLWTQMMIGGWCFAYAATGEDKYYEYARKAMDNMFLQIDIPGVDFAETEMGKGFITRSLVRDDEGDVFTSKEPQSNWHLVEWEGREYYWKDDTSSDETTGHFFGFPVFYDLCAKTADEKAEVASYAGMLADYILEGDFRLIDLDGEPTTHGHWEPERIAIAVDGFGECIAAGYDIDACGEAFGGGGWLNSLEILGHMLAAWHMTGEEKFYDAYNMLITEHRYDEVAMANENTLTITNPAIANHSDHELAILAYTTLIRYEPNDDRREKWVESLKFMYDYERPERNPWWAGVYALSGGGADVDVESMRRTLREMPDDLRNWHFDNSHRTDANLEVNDRFGDKQFDRVFPFGEIRTMWWNGNPYEMVYGGDGRSRTSPTNWLLPYYLNLYAGTLK